MYRKLILFLLIVITLIGGAGCSSAIIGSGTPTDKTYDLSGFSSIKADSGFGVEIKRSDTFSVTVTTDDNIMQYLDVSVSGNVLQLSLRNHSSITVRTLKAVITMPVLEGVNLAEGVRTSVTGFDSDFDFSVTISGGSLLEGDIKAGSVGIGISSGSTVRLEGSADELLARSSDGSIIDMEDFQFHDADINIDAGGQAVIKIDGTLNTTLTAGSQLTYIGDPEMGEVNVSGGSTLKRR